MAIIIKNAAQIEKMRVSGRIVKEAHELLAKIIAPGISTREIENSVVSLLKKNRATPSFKGYRGFPRSICISVNQEVIHGMSDFRRLNSGDIVSVDIGAYKDGFHGDAARTYGVGAISEEAQFLIDVTRQSFYEGVKFAKPLNFVNNISTAIEEYVVAQGLVVVREFVGHGVGAEIHEEPEITNFNQKKRGPRLKAGMTIAIEPMVTLGSHEVEILSDGWTVVTKDGSLAAHYENTVLITDGEPEILTI
ncbi:MAG: type I methionyl aminopeptidase [Defluviitaleaceae bacterium]|nr:type I methionyl aminopeptidase [Defluviitaleaceae bacterium]